MPRPSSAQVSAQMAPSTRSAGRQAAHPVVVNYCYGARHDRSTAEIWPVDYPRGSFASVLHAARSFYHKRAAASLCPLAGRLSAACTPDLPFSLPDEARAPPPRFIARQSQASPKPNTMSLATSSSPTARVADGKPAFCVFDNKTIDAIVDAKPTSAAFAAAAARPTKRENTARRRASAPSTAAALLESR